MTRCGYPTVKSGRIEVRMTPDEHGRFTVLSDGAMVRWTIEQIRAAAYDGIAMKEWA